MKVIVVGTANPADFFNGDEPSELVMMRIFSFDDPTMRDYENRLLLGGYVVIKRRL